MPEFGFAFNAQNVPPAEPGGAVWEGIVPMQITRSETVDTASKDGSRMLVFHVKALAGDYTGQENVIRLNLWNRNPQASEIASRQLSSICHCTNRMQITSSEQLHGATLIGVWAKEERKVTDQQTGRDRIIDGCQCKDFRLIDGRTIKEMIAGAPASAPYAAGAPNMSNPQGAGVQPGMMPPGGAPPQGAAPGAPGFPQPAPQQPQGQPQAQYQPAPQQFQQPGAPAASPQYAPPMGGPAPAGGFVPPGQGGGMPGTAPGISTAASPYNPAGPQPGQGGGFVPPGGGQAPGGFAPPGGAPGGATTGFGGQQPGAPGGFQPPAGAGPWGQQR